MWGYQPFGMMGYGWTDGGWVMMLFGLVVLVLIGAAVFWFVRNQAPSGPHLLQPSQGSSKGLDALDERYARGEILRDEYLQKKNDLAK